MPVRLPLLPTDETGVKTDFIWNGDGTFTVTSEQDCEAVLDSNKALYTHNDGYSPSREWRRAASIPAGVLMQWREELGFDPKNPGASDPLAPCNREFLLRKLNDPDWLYLRTAPGRL